MAIDNIRDIDIADMLTTTLYSMDKGTFYSLAENLQDYEFYGYILKNKDNIIEKENGVGLEHYIFKGSGAKSRWVGLWEDDMYDFKNMLTKLNVNWCRLTDTMVYERRMVLENRGEARINNVIKPQERDMMLRMVETLEDAFFEDPDANDNRIMWGLKYWIVKNATQGFNGGAASGFTTVAGVSLTEVPKYKNWTDTYTNVTKTDLVAKMRKAHRKTNWKSPLTKEQFRGDFGNRRVIYVNEATIEGMEEIGEAQNENLGRDLAPYDDTMVFRKHPIRYAVKLDDDTSNPVYMIDKDTFKVAILSGDYFRKTDVHKHPTKHNVFCNEVDLSINTLCLNRRSNAVLYVA